MLVLTRRLGEGLLIGDNIKITIEKISKSKIKIDIQAPKDVVVCREEVVKKINEGNVLPSVSRINSQNKL
jgi:carbon storage regulator